MTAFQLADSAKAPCTRTTVAWDLSCGSVFIVLPLFHWWVSDGLLDRPRSLLHAGTFCTKVVQKPQRRKEPAEFPRIPLLHTRVNSVVFPGQGTRREGATGERRQAG